MLLADTAGAQVVGTTVQRLESPNPATYIGKGKVGLEAFRLILADPRLRDVPLVLETEKGDDLAEDRVNLAVLRSVLTR